MKQTSRIVRALKNILKYKGVTYRDLAVELNLSEASVKRVFAEENFSLERLDRICEFIDIEISDLTHLVEQERKIGKLTLEQEMELAADKKLMLVTQLVINRWNFDEILQYFVFDEHELLRILARLDKLKLIVLLPGNRVKLMISRKFSWIDEGPVRQFFKQNVQREFFKSDFDLPGESLTFVTGMLSGDSRGILLQRLDKLVHDFDEMCNIDSALPIEKRFGYSLVLAVRPWALSVFNEFIREKCLRSGRFGTRIPQHGVSSIRRKIFPKLAKSEFSIFGGGGKAIPCTRV